MGAESIRGSCCTHKSGDISKPCVEDVSEIDCMVKKQGVFLGPDSKCGDAQLNVCLRMRGACCTSATTCNATLRVDECKLPSMFVGYGKRCHLCAPQFQIAVEAGSPRDPATGLLYQPHRSGLTTGSAAAVAVVAAAAATDGADPPENLRVAVYGEVVDEKNRKIGVNLAVVNLISKSRVRLASTRTGADGRYVFKFAGDEFDALTAQENYPVVVQFGDGNAQGKNCVQSTTQKNFPVNQRQIVAKGGAQRILYARCGDDVRRVKRMTLHDSSSSSEEDDESSFSVSTSDDESTSDIQVFAESTSVSSSDGESWTSSHWLESTSSSSSSDEGSDSDSDGDDDDDDSHSHHSTSSRVAQFFFLLLLVCLCLCGILCCLGYVNAYTWDEATGVDAPATGAETVQLARPPATPPIRSKFEASSAAKQIGGGGGGGGFISRMMADGSSKLQ